MPPISSVFNPKRVSLGNGNLLFIIDVPSLTPQVTALIDKEIVRICYGTKSTRSVNAAKQRIAKFLSTKDSLKQMGAVAEFFIHLFLNEQKLTQQCLFFNLEENSVKKGFDGFYSYGTEQWLLESKSGGIGKAFPSHPQKVREGYSDLRDKLSGKTTNNPWENAYNHAGHVNVKAKASLLTQIQSFSDDYEKSTFHDIKNFNIIPGATVFLGGNWVPICPMQIEADIKRLIAKMTFKKIKIICITKMSLQLFEDYLTQP